MLKELRIEMGRRWIAAEDVAQLAPGSVIELDSLADEAVSISVDGRVIARGEPAIMDGKFCVRVWERLGRSGEAGGAEARA